MARYIDADVLIKDIVKRFGCRPYIEVGNKCEYIHNIVDEQPTAYDVDAVVAELEKAESVKNFGSRNSGNLLIPLKDAIDIVRNAGKDGAE